MTTRTHDDQYELYQSYRAKPGEVQFAPEAVKGLEAIVVSHLREIPAEQFLGQRVVVKRCIHEEHDLCCACQLLDDEVAIEDVGYRTDGVATFGIVGNNVTRLIHGEFDRRR